MNSDFALPADRYPRSWWQVGWSHDLAAGEVRALRYFGEDLVMWRSDSGAVFVQDAFCTHLGAHAVWVARSWARTCSALGTDGVGTGRAATR